MGGGAFEAEVEEFPDDVELPEPLGVGAAEDWSAVEGLLSLCDFWPSPLAGLSSSEADEGALDVDAPDGVL